MIGTGFIGGALAGPFPAAKDLTTTNNKQVTNVKYHIVEVDATPTFLNQRLKQELPWIAAYNTIGNAVSSCPRRVGGERDE
jgi:hypothetical protein